MGTVSIHRNVPRRIAPNKDFRIQPRCLCQRPAHMKGHSTTPMTMPRPINWNSQVKKFTIRSSVRPYRYISRVQTIFWKPSVTFCFCKAGGITSDLRRLSRLLGEV